MNPITLEQVQHATARCLDAHPAIDTVLPQESHLLVELLGRMIYTRSEAIDDTALSASTIAELHRWGCNTGSTDG
ncbi:MAG: hypothetical protein JWN23_1064 [Rhodocyclales bacterium]|nr:hypothetical protein [Rhodocyclales bacterium]